MQRTVHSALWTGAIGCLVAIAIAVSASAGSYALWNGATNVTGGSMSAGSAAITINGSTTATLALGALGPGESTTTPLTIANTGSTPVSLAVTDTAIGTDAASLAVAPQLTATLTSVADPTRCQAGLTGGSTGTLTGFTTTSAPIVLAKDANATLCLQLSLATSAPSTMQGKSAAFTMSLTGTQVAP